jgi:hypothetical protein
MSIADNKFVQVDGSPTVGRQPVKQSVFNDELRSWGEYLQTDDQVLTATTLNDVTCDGGERSVTSPSGATAVWNTGTSQGTFVANGAYHFSVSITFTTASNNNSVTIRLVNVSDANDFLDTEVTLDRTGTEVTYDAVFDLISTGSVVKIQCNPSSTATIKETRIFTKREY